LYLQSIKNVKEVKKSQVKSMGKKYGYIFTIKRCVIFMTEIVNGGLFTLMGLPTVCFGVISDIPHKFEVSLTKTIEKHVFCCVYN